MSVDMYVECDFCGDDFDASEADSEMAEHDWCVCPNCLDSAREQLTLSGEIEEENEDEDW